MKGPIDLFFALGDKVTGGDPRRQQDFMYYMLWILFLACFTMFLNNLYMLITTGDLNYAIWMLVGFAISGLQFFSLKGMYDMRKIRSKGPIKKEDEKVETVDEMMEGFKKTKEKKEVKKQDVRKKT